MYLALGIVFLLIALAVAGLVTYTTVKSYVKDNELLSKKNLFYLIPSFLLIYALYLIAAAYKGDEIDFFYCFSLIDNVLDTFSFTAQTDLILPVATAFPVFYADFVIAYILAVATAVLSVLSFFSLKIRNFIRKKRLIRKECDIIVGDSSDAIKYLKNNKNSILWGTDLTRQRNTELLKDGFTVYKYALNSKKAIKNFKGKHQIIVFRDGKHSYTEVIETFTELKKNGSKARLHLEANQEETKIIKEKFISKADGASSAAMSCFNKYELIARSFVQKYPITKYIPRSFYNDNFSLKNKKSINVVFLGFGKINYQLFRMFSMQFQFAEEFEGKLRSKPVNYFVYDSENKRLHNEFFSRIKFEFDEVFKDCDFPKPEKICNLEVSELDANSVDARKECYGLVNDDSFTYFIVSLENDLEDASYARTLKRLFSDKAENFRIFVRAKNTDGEKLNRDNDSIIYFGEESKVYSHDSIVNDDLLDIAQRLNLLYNTILNPPEWLEKIKKLPPEEQFEGLNKVLELPGNKDLMIEWWEKLPFIEQSSNLYHALNLPFKLNLMGLDMVKKEKAKTKGISSDEFYKLYKNEAKQKNYTDYSFYFGLLPCNVLAFIEHSRWNALYVLYDYKQMKKKDMKPENGKVVHKDIPNKRHACLTTYYGLDELVKFKFGKLYPEEDIKAVSNTDERLYELGKIYAYDYMDLDRIYAELTSLGYVIE